MVVAVSVIVMAVPTTVMTSVMPLLITKKYN